MKVNYYTNETKGVVVCKINNVHETLAKELDKHNVSMHPALLEYFLEKIPDSFVGKATCSKEDREKGLFNEETGRKIAYKRAYIKVASSKKRWLLHLIDDIKANHEFLENQVAKMADKYDNRLSAAIISLDEAIKNI